MGCVIKDILLIQKETAKNQIVRIASFWIKIKSALNVFLDYAMMNHKINARIVKRVIIAYLVLVWAILALNAYL